MKPDVAIISHIEADINNMNTNMKVFESGVRLYEKEAVRCFKSIREKGGWLKDCPIYCLCCTENTPSENTLNELKKLGVMYIHDYTDDVKKFTSGFLTIPYTGYYFEELNPIKENITIKLDLDNVLLKPFTMELVYSSIDATIVGQYNKDFDIGERMCYNTNPFDTSLIISCRDNHFYKEYYNLCFSDKVLKSKEWEAIKKVTGEYWLEEFVVDYMYYNKIKPIYPIRNYQYGFDYPSLKYFIQNKLLDGLYLSHEHLTR